MTASTCKAFRAGAVRGSVQAVTPGAGLEWLFRLASEPRRLWKRCLEHHPRFVFFFIRRLLGFRRSW